MERLTKFDSADYLKTEEECAEYLKVCSEFGSPEHTAQAREMVERARKRFSQ